MDDTRWEISIVCAFSDAEPLLKMKKHELFKFSLPARRVPPLVALWCQGFFRTDGSFKQCKPVCNAPTFDKPSPPPPSRPFLVDIPSSSLSSEIRLTFFIRIFRMIAYRPNREAARKLSRCQTRGYLRELTPSIRTTANQASQVERSRSGNLKVKCFARSDVSAILVFRARMLLLTGMDKKRNSRHFA